MTKETSQKKNVRILEGAVLEKTPKEVLRIMEEQGAVGFTARALGLACRYRGLEMVKALVAGGARFDSCVGANRGYENPRLTINGIGLGSGLSDYALMLLDSARAGYGAYGVNETDSDGKREIIPLTARLGIVDYLCDNAEKIGFDSGNLLYFSILTGSEKIYKRLKSRGAVLNENIKTALTIGAAGEEWQFFQSVMLRCADTGHFTGVIGMLSGELNGEKLKCTMTFYFDHSRKFETFPEAFELFLDNFDQSKMNKTSILKDIITRELTPCLAAAEKQGWLNNPKKRDEMIKFASDNGKTESAAWLLDFKNRTADFAAERAKAEKKAERELNADPNSVSELKKTWSYKKREDGTLVITSYKGSKTEITVPAKIGKETVTAIGAYALSPHAPRRTQEQANNRARIQKINLPDSVKVIEEGAFELCMALKEINVPDGVSEICNSVFLQCNIKSLILPDSVKSIGEYAFSSCPSLEKINLPDGISQIGRCAFSVCNALKEIEIPDGVTELPDGLFNGCVSLKTVKIPASVKVMGNGIFLWCSGLESIELPDGITEISADMFGRCSSLQSINIPRSVTKIGSFAFSECTSLKKAVVPEGVTEIGSRAFIHCAFLETLELPASVKKIENYRSRDDAPQTILHNSPNATVLVQPKSYAEKYCKRYGIKFEYK